MRRSFHYNKPKETSILDKQDRKVQYCRIQIFIDPSVSVPDEIENIKKAAESGIVRFKSI